MHSCTDFCVSWCHPKRIYYDGIWAWIGPSNFDIAIMQPKTTSVKFRKCSVVIIRIACVYDALYCQITWSFLISDRNDMSDVLANLMSCTINMKWDFDSNYSDTRHIYDGYTSDHFASRHDNHRLTNLIPIPNLGEAKRNSLTVFPRSVKIPERRRLLLHPWKNMREQAPPTSILKRLFVEHGRLLHFLVQGFAVFSMSSKQPHIRYSYNANFWLNSWPPSGNIIRFTLTRNMDSSVCLGVLCYAFARLAGD